MNQLYRNGEHLCQLGHIEEVDGWQQAQLEGVTPAMLRQWAQASLFINEIVQQLDCNCHVQDDAENEYEQALQQMGLREEDVDWLTLGKWAIYSADSQTKIGRISLYSISHEGLLRWRWLKHP